MTKIAEIYRHVVAGYRRFLHAAILSIAAAFSLSACVTVPANVDSQEQQATPVLDQFEDMSAEEIAAEGDEAWRNGDLERAVFIYMQSLSQTDDPAVWLKVGKIQQYSGQSIYAWQAFERVLALDPDNAEGHEYLGMMYIGSRQKELAVRHLERAAELDATRWVASNALGVLADATGDYERAIGYYETALKQQPESAMLITNLGYSHYLAGQLEEAEKLFIVAIGIDRHYEPAAANLGLVRARRGQYDSAVDILENVMTRAKALNDVGYIAFVNGDIEDAERLLGDAVRASPTYYETAYENLDRLRAVQEANRPRAEDMNVASIDGTHGSTPVEYRQVRTDRLNVRGSDSIDAPIVGFLAARNRVRVLMDQGAWSFVAFEAKEEENSISGWVMSGFLAELPEESE